MKVATDLPNVNVTSKSTALLDVFLKNTLSSFTMRICNVDTNVRLYLYISMHCVIEI